MSKIIKSGRCVESHPRQLNPVDVDAFFINNNEEEEETLAQDLETVSDIPEETPANPNEEEVGDGIKPEIDSNVEGSPIEAEPKIGIGSRRGWALPKENLETSKPEGFDLNRLANVAETIDSLISRAKQQAGTIAESAQHDAGSILEGASARAEEALEKAKQKADEITYGANHKAGSILKGASARAEEALEKAKQKADQITYGANHKAGSILEGASVRAEEALDKAKQKANEITHGAHHEAGSIITGANQQAESIINIAKDQAELILEGSRQQADKTIEKAKRQAEVIVENAKRQLELTIGEAKQQAETVLEEAKQQGISIKEQAHKDGIEAGRQDGINVVRQELSNNLTQALSLLNEVETGRMQRLTTSEPELLKLAVHIAEKIIGDEIKLTPSRQLEIAREALAKVATANTVTLKIHPEDLKAVQENLPMLQSSFSEPKPIKIQEDLGISQGSCFIETDHGNVDARIKSQLERIMTELLKVGQIG